MTGPGDEAQRKVADAEDGVRSLNFRKAAQSYHDAAGLFLTAGDPDQSSLCEAKEDFYLAHDRIEANDYVAALSKAETSLAKFRKVHDQLWMAKSKALGLKISSLRLLQFDKFEEMSKLSEEAKRVLEEIRGKYPSEQEALQKDILDIDIKFWMEKFHSAIESKALDKAVDAIRRAMQANSDLVRLLTGDSRTIQETQGEIMQSREALARGEDYLEKWEVKEAHACFEVSKEHLSQAGHYVEAFKGDHKPAELDDMRNFVQATEVFRDGLDALANAVDKSITRRQAAAGKDFADSIKKFKSADNLFTQAGGARNRLAEKARRYERAAQVQANALKLTVPHFIIGAGKQSALFGV